MDKRILFLLITGMLSVCLNPLQSQTYESRNYIKIPPDREIIKIMKAKNCPEILDAGTVVQYETKRKKGTVEYTVSRRDSLKDSKAYPFDKEIKVKLKSLPGKANLSMDEKDSSTFLVNYWLSEKVVLKSGTAIQLLNGKLRCDTLLMEYEQGTKHVLKNDTTFYLAWVYLHDTLNPDISKKLKYKQYDTLQTIENTKTTTFGIKSLEDLVIVCYNDTLNDWYRYTNMILKTFEGDKLTNIYTNMYDRDGQYTLKLQNREYISYRKHGLEFGALTIPFKYRFGFSKTVEGVDIKVKDEFIADLNIGAYGGYQFGRYRLRMEGNKLRDLAKVGGSFGGFLNLSTTVIDSLSSTAAGNPFTKEQKSTIGIISPGFAAMFTLYNFQIGAFLGWDIGLGQDRKSWNFNGRPWLGFGLGYTINGLWKK